jgi:hypothetical protein
MAQYNPEKAIAIIRADICPNTATRPCNTFLKKTIAISI